MSAAWSGRSVAADSSISNSYAMGAVPGEFSVGGLVGHSESNISVSYATGYVSGAGAVGGLVGSNTGTPPTDSYWDTETSGQLYSDGGSGKTTAELQTPTGNAGIYANWGPEAWDFGTSSQYPALKADFNGDGTATWQEFGEQVRVAAVTVRLSLTGSPRMTAVQVTATFNKAVTGFTVDDVTVANGAASNFPAATGGMVYTFDVTPSEVAKVTVNIAADVATDSGGNGNEAATQLSFIPYDDDRNGNISRAEVTVAIRDYFADKLTRDQVTAVIRLYFNPGS